MTVVLTVGASAHREEPDDQGRWHAECRLGEQLHRQSDGFDPTGEYLGDAFGILTDLLVRTLIGYRHTPGGPGNTLVADIATSVPKPTNGGKTYTFHIKPDIKFSPPVSRAVVCRLRERDASASRTRRTAASTRSTTR